MTVFTNLKSPRTRVDPSLPLAPLPRKTMICFLSPYSTWHFLEFDMHGIIRYIFFLSAFVYQHTYFEIPILSCVQNSSSLLITSSIPLSDSIQSLFIHSPEEGHLALLAVFSYYKQSCVNIRASLCMNICSHFSGANAWEWIGWITETARLFFKVVVAVYTPRSHAGAFQWLHILVNTCCGRAC